MKPPVPHTSQAIRRQIAALDGLIRQQETRRDALLMRTRTPAQEQQLNKAVSEISRLWQGKDYWQGLLDVRVAWERAIRGTPVRPPKQLPQGPAPPTPVEPPTFEPMPKPGRVSRSRVPHFERPFPEEPYLVPDWAPAEDKRCIREWNAWREKAKLRWNRWMTELERWDYDMSQWERQQVQRSRRERGLTEPPPRPKQKLPPPPTCALPDYGDPA